MSSRRVTWVIVAVAAIMAVIVPRLLDGKPGKDDPNAYARYTVQKAIDRYRSDGREATLAYYSDPANVDGSWYVFIIDQDGYNIAHYNPDRIGMDPALRVDVTGYFYGDDLMSATEEGRWVEYVFLNPDTGREQKKHTWAVRHDGLIFGTGWYEGSD